MSNGHDELKNLDKKEMGTFEKQSYIILTMAGLGEEELGQSNSCFTKGRMVNYLMKDIFYGMKNNFNRKTVKLIVTGIFLKLHLAPMNEFAKGIVDYNGENVFLENGKKISDKIFKDRMIVDIDRYATAKQVITKNNSNKDADNASGGDNVEGYLDINYSEVPEGVKLEPMTLGELRQKIFKELPAVQGMFHAESNFRNESND